MSIDDFFRRLIAAHERTNVPYMVTGSWASSTYGIPRATNDIDIVIAPTREQLAELLKEFPDESYYADGENALNALRHRSQFNVIDFASGWKADMIVRKDRGFSLAEFGRRRRHVVVGLPVYLTSAEDILIAKLEFAKLGESARQVEDAAGIIKRQGDELDRGYVERWVAELGLDEQWRAARLLAG